MINDKPLEILVIDDETEAREIIAESITLTGAIAAKAVDGIDGVENYIAKRKTGAPYNAVLTDLNMPRGSGAYVTQKVKELDPLTQVIVVTGYEPEGEYKKLSEQLQQLKPDGVIRKPIGLDNIKHIVNMVKSVIEIRKTVPDFQPEYSVYTPPQSQS